MSQNKIVDDTLEWLSASSKPLEGEALIAKAENIKDWVIEEINEFIDAVRSGDREAMLDAVVDANWIINNLPFFAGLTTDEIDETARKVRLSNFSKYCQTKEEAELSVKAYSTASHPNKKDVYVYCESFETGNAKYPYAVRKVIDGKLMKSINFKDVNEF